MRAASGTDGAILGSAPVGLIGLDATGRVGRANVLAATLLGMPVAELVDADLHALLHGAAAHSRAECPFTRAATGAGPLRGEQRWVRPDGAALIVGWHAGPIALDTPAGAVVVLEDVTDRAEAADRDRFLAGLERELQPLDDPEETMAAVARLVGEHLACDRCAYAEAEADEDHFTMTGSYARGLPPLVGRMAMSDFSAETLRSMRAGEPYVVSDAFTDPRVLPEQRAIYRDTGITAVICVPLRKAGRFVAAMAVHHATPRVWTAAEIDLLSTVVARCWESLQRAHALAAVRESEARYRVLVEQASDGIWLADQRGRYVEVNPAGCAMLGWSRAEYLAMSVDDLVRPEDGDRFEDLLTTLAAGRPTTDVWHLRHRDGSWVPVELSMRQSADGTLLSIGRDISARLRAEAERERRYQAEHEVAEVLQRSLLPAGLPQLARLAAAAQYTPSARYAQSGGDWYDVVPVGATSVALVVGDVVGHGPAAAAVMGQLRSALAAQLLDGHPPAAALERLDRFAARVTGSAGSTCACLLWDWASGELRWALAGHPPVLLVDGDGARFLDGGAGPVLGVPGRAPYTEAGAVVPAGTSAVLYTDGLVERRGETLDAGLRRLAAVADGVGDRSPAELVAALVDGALDDAGPADDIALLVVRAVPAPLTGRLPAVAGSMRALRRRTAGWVAAAGLPVETAEDLELALGEAAANAAEHAYPEGSGEFEYGVGRADDGALEVRVRDFGRWRPVPEDNGYRGHGLRVIRELTEDVRIDRGADGTEVRFRLPARTPDAPAPVRRATIGRPGDLATVQEWPGGLLVVRGDVDLTGRDAIGPALLRAAAGPGPTTVDLTGVRYLSSAGVALLAEAAGLAGAAGRAVSLVVAAGSAPARVLELTGLDTVLPVAVQEPPAAVEPP